MASFALGSERYEKDSSRLDGILDTLKKKDPRLHGLLTSKMEEITRFPEHYKPLCGVMAGLRRAHVGTSKVLTYTINYREKTVEFQEFGAWEDVYRK